MADALVLSGIHKRYGQFVAVDDIDLRVPVGQIFGLLGPNGAGKTSTIRMVMSILHPDRGEICVLGHSQALAVKDRIGYLPEERGLYRKMTVERTLRYFGELKGLRGADLSERVRAALAGVGLSDWLRKPVESLSKGMQQKLQFVATVLHSPELVILDEPFSGLDPLNTELLRQLILDLRARGATVILCTHQMEQAQRLCDRLALLNRGRVVIEGGVDQIRARFAAQTLLVEGDGDFAPLARLRGVRQAQFHPGRARLELDDASDTNALLHKAAECGRVARFEIQRPDLHEIFVRLIGGEDAQAAMPAGGGA